MRRSSVVWILSIVITLASAVYQRMTGPTYPVTVRQDFGGTPVQARLARAHAGEGDHELELRAGDPAVTGEIRWKRFKTADEWRTVPLARQGETLRGSLPHQPVAGKLQYDVVLHKGSSELRLPAECPVVIRFRGDVPAPVLIVHIIAMFGGMLLSTQTGFAALVGKGDVKRLTFWTLIFLGVGGLILGPIVQKYAFEAFWTGWPFGTDLTDNKTVAAVLIWLAAWFAQRRRKDARWWIVGAAVATLVVFLIPHSMFGSELDYSKVPVK